MTLPCIFENLTGRKLERKLSLKNICALLCLLNFVNLIKSANSNVKKNKDFKYFINSSLFIILSDSEK